MSSLNKACILGNVGKVPEIRSTASGTKVATLSVATSRKWTSSTGEKQEKTEWHRLVVWNRGKSGLADVVEKYVGQGDKLYVEGTIEYRQYEKDGQTRYITEINVGELILLGGKKTTAPEPEASYGDDDEMPF